MEDTPSQEPAPEPANSEDKPLSVATYVGHTLKEIRLRFQLTLAELAQRTGISRGMLSKIENAQTLPGLDTLFRIAEVLGVSMSSFFGTLDAREQGAQHIKGGKAPEVLRPGSKHGYHYHLISQNPESYKPYEPFIICLDENSKPFPFFEHPGVELIHVLEGSLEYRHGQYTYVLEPDDSLSFPSSVPHGPERILKTPARLLVVMIHPA